VLTTNIRQSCDSALERIEDDDNLEPIKSDIRNIIYECDKLDGQRMMPINSLRTVIEELRLWRLGHICNPLDMADIDWLLEQIDQVISNYGELYGK